MTGPADEAQPTQRPTLQLVRGDAEPEELAALLAVLTARGGGPAAVPAPLPPRGRWADPGRQVRSSITSGPGAWLGSGRPRA